MPRTSNRMAAVVPASIRPEATSKASGAGTRSCHSTISSSSTSSPAAIWLTTLPHAVVRIPGDRMNGTSSIGLPKPMMSNSTSGWS